MSVSEQSSECCKKIPTEVFKVDKEVLRGIPLHHALQWPRIWLQPDRYRHSDRSARLWSASKATQRLDVFLSHAWEAPGMSKLIALLLQNGWLHGLLGWSAMTALGFCLRLLHVINAPFTVSLAGAGRQGEVFVSPWLLLLGFMGTVLGLFSSVYLPIKTQLCFLDIACVHQGDPELLRRGISNIGGCLSVSSELRVLYHPSYFRSLWCIFELAAFRETNPGYSCSVLPLFLFGAEIWCWLWAFSTSLGVLWLADSAPGRTSVGNPLFVALFVGGVFLPTCLLVYFCRTKYREKHQLLRDLQFFQFDKVSCKTDFDRSFICSAIKQWYGSQEAFVNLVRGPIRDELLNMLPSPHIPVGHVMFISSSTTSLLLEGIAALYLAGKLDYDAAIAILAWASHILFALPIGFNLLFYISDHLASSRGFVTSLAKSLAGASIAAAWVAVSIGMATVSSWLGSIWLSVTCFLLHLLLFSWVFRPSLLPKDEVISI